MGKFKDNYSFNLKGKFRIIDKTNKKEILYEDNLIVDKARNILRDLLFEANTDDTISIIKFGDKGHADGDITTPVAPQSSDTSLEETDSSLIYSKNIDSKQKDGDTSIIYSCTLNNNEANLNNGTFTITEAGLFNANGNMFARKTFPAIIKTSDRVFEFQWTIIF